MEKIKNNHILVKLPNIQVSNSLDRQELEILVAKTDTCCKNSKIIYGKFWFPDGKDTIKKLKFNNREFFVQEMTDRAMGGRECFHKFYATCRESDNSCFVFYLKIYYKYPYDSEKETWGELDFDINKELMKTYFILMSLKFKE